VRRAIAIGFGAAVLVAPALALALPAPTIQIGLGEAEGASWAPAVKMLGLLTLLALAPAVVLCTTSFTRILVVLSFLRQAIGTHSAPPGQVVVLLSLMLTGVVMAPIAARVDEQAIRPYLEGRMQEEEALEAAKAPIREFLLRQTRENDLELFYRMTRSPAPETPVDVAMHLLVPAFLISELRTAFEMGFLLFLPFVLIEIVVASVLSSMGMVMLPPTIVSMPLKLLLFVAVDGWSLLARSLVASFG
jgi:flagellar biosynthetic protein FliP